MTDPNIRTERTISLIKQGTVIDHIDTDAVFKIIKILDLEHYGDLVTIGLNMPSPKLKFKGIIKIENRLLSKDDVNKISVFSPHATINYIKEYEVEKKYKVEIPDEVDRILKCANPNCVTNLEKVTTKFVVLTKEPLVFICKFCERRLFKTDFELT